MNAALIVRFWYTSAVLWLGVAVITVVLVLARERQRRLPLTYAGFLASLWCIVLSFAIEAFGHIAASGGGAAIVAAVVSGVGGVAYILVSPSLYHTILGLPTARAFRLVYRCVNVLTLALVAVLAIEALRPLASSILNLVLFAHVLYGIVLVGFGYRRITERSLRRAIRVFVFLAAAFFPWMFWEARRGLTGSAPAWAWLDHFALPSFFAVLAALSIPFALRRMNRPAFWIEGAPTEHFAVEYRLSARELEVIGELCRGLSNRQIATTLFISPKTVENHLSRIFTKTDVTSRLQLLTLLLSNQ